ncbi:hypothetical protein AALK14_10180 [Butyricimonas hominis]|uniref:golvesin C-terminal-like domain-containing protein n=1 Tax=Butyricimonas TaxID=574697 RepID=UPI003513846C
MKDLREMICIVIYEMKQQLRSWVFRVFALLSLVGIVACHVYWQGEGNCVNWKVVALPCSMPLMNAYLWGGVQSLFLVVMMSGIPGRVNRTGAVEAIQVRPFHNDSYYRGVVAGNFLLFLLLNVVVILFSVVLVNWTSLAPVGWKYYLFYLLTLNIPAWVFVAGLTLWLGGVVRSRWLAIAIPVIWWLGSIFVLPYWQHGTLDYLASGVPNLFSEVTGHLNPGRYALHRLAYLFVGMGLLVWSANLMRRIPNCPGRRKGHVSVGVLLVVAGVLCGGMLEYTYYRDRQSRESWRDSFVRNWEERTCRVSRHAITVEQSGNTLAMQSDMTVYNPGREQLERIVLFLNPGLRVTGLSTGDGMLEYRREGQVLSIARALGAGDSLRLRMEYSGHIDDRFCDLHLRDSLYEDAFYHDRFYATGRQGAFVEDDLLVLTPASVWYPVAIPPVNPLMPIATGRDFTRFHLEVRHPRQREVISQGVPVKGKESVVFENRKVLHGISLCGVNERRYEIPTDMSLNLQLNSPSWGSVFEKRYSTMSREDFIATWTWTSQSNRYGLWKNCLSKNWYTPEVPYLYLFEVPVSFRLDNHTGKTESGLVEPGMVFLRERGFDMSIGPIMNDKEMWYMDTLFGVTNVLYDNIFGSSRTPSNSHPLLGIGKNNSKTTRDLIKNDHNGKSLDEVQRVWVHSSKYPFMGKIWNDFFLEDLESSLGVPDLLGISFVKKQSDFFVGRSLVELLANNEKFELREKLNDLWYRLTLKIPKDELRQSLDSLYDYSEGEVDYDSLMRKWAKRWNTDVEGIIADWLTTKHRQYFKVKDAVCYFDKDFRRYKCEGKIMNAGKDGGIVSIEYGSFIKIQSSNCYLNPGEAKAFTLVTNESITSINTILAANRPTSFNFQRENIENSVSWEFGEEWRTIPVSEFLEGENPNEFIVDDSDTGFRLKEGSRSWLQQCRETSPPLVKNSQMGDMDRRWKRVIDVNACGDSIRGYHYIIGGSGKSTATWRLNIPEAGRYRVMVRVYKAFTKKWVRNQDEKRPSVNGVIYYYTVAAGGQEREVEINLDYCLSGTKEFSAWTSLGEFDFPAGEASVTLSDKEVRRREEVAIVADAVKWVKLD